MEPGTSRRQIRVLLLGILAAALVIALCVIAYVVLVDWVTTPIQHAPPIHHRRH